MNNRDDPSQSPEESHRQHQEFEDGANDLWSLYGKEAQIYDESWMKTMKDDMGGILIFAGIFSAVLTAFLVPKIQDLKVDSADQSAYYQNQTVHMLDRISQQLASIGDQISIDSNSPLPYPTFYPSVSDMRVNLSWLFSLICSLFAAFLATLVQLWSKNYMHIFQQANNPLRFARTRVSLFEGPKRLSELAEAVHGLMQISVMLFLWGLGDAIGQINRNIFLFVLPPIAMGSCLYIYWTWSSIRNPLSPYRTPLAMFISIFISLFIWYVIQNLSRGPRYSHFYGKVVQPLSIEIIRNNLRWKRPKSP
ncbi:hypothetical protein BGY98DRAFT_917075 [Russula aff. rugulosa BPL654]|nr:hypothetical protein BGY98DRAFT_917075 [Russula aff. rugulosa BPL654]